MRDMRDAPSAADARTFCHPWWTLRRGEGPLLATALHAGHGLRDELGRVMALDEATRLREEDPFTDYLAGVAPSAILPRRSRFEVDLNRPRDEAVYQRPEDAWGLPLWQTPPSAAMVAQSLAEYDAFYRQLKVLLDDLQARYGRFVVFDLHSYNHRRDGPDAPPADPAANPEVNVGTGSMDRAFWAPVVDRFMHDLAGFDFLGRRLDVRENIKFVGRQFPAWVHSHYPHTGCVLAIEFKKTFMDEWSGVVEPRKLEALQAALRATLPGIIETLERL